MTVQSISVEYKGPLDPAPYDIVIVHDAADAADLIEEAQSFAYGEYGKSKVHVRLYASMGESQKTLWAYWGRADEAVAWLMALLPKVQAYANKNLPSSEPKEAVPIGSIIVDSVLPSIGIPQYQHTIKGPMIGDDAKADLWDYMKAKITAELVQDQYAPLNAVQKVEVWDVVKQQLSASSLLSLFPTMGYSAVQAISTELKFTGHSQQLIIESLCGALDSNPYLVALLKAVLNKHP